MQLRIASLCLLAAACTSSPQQTSLEHAQTTWKGSAPPSYSFVWQRSCECTGEVTRAMQVVVEHDTVDSATYVDDHTAVSTTALQSLQTINGVFATIQSAIDENAFRIVVAYDPTLGYPTSVAIDYKQLTADEELSLNISDVNEYILAQ